jgi:enolase-phosphatase E1
MQCVLLDIEGTTSSIRFVYDEMFPYVRRELERYLHDHWGEAATSEACDAIARDAGHTSLEAWSESVGAADDDSRRDLIRREVLRLMDADAKATGLKQLQGLIWEAGFHSGELKAHVYDDVPPALRAWNERGIDVRIYSSGSVQAQELFFGHTIVGNLLPLLRGHYDTTTGPKREAESYRKIAAAFDLPPSEILFVSDVVAELDAAYEAGVQTALAVRPGNAAVESPHGHRSVHSFADLLSRADL